MSNRSEQQKPVVEKIGTIDCDMVETTPLVFKGDLYRFEYVRPGYRYNNSNASYFRLVNTHSGQKTPSFAVNHHLGSAYAEDDVVYAYGVAGTWGESTINVFSSSDLETWSKRGAFTVPGWEMFNTSVCKGDGRYIMAVEIGAPPEVVGVRFTMRFAESQDLCEWCLLPDEYVYSRDRYTACPALRFFDGFYYMIYLEAKPGPLYEPHIVRSPDLIEWQSSPLNPVMSPSEGDKRIANPDLTPEHVKNAVNINNSDIDLCEFNGETVIYYSWGNQQGTEFLGEAVHRGDMQGFLEGFFPPHNRK